LEEKMKEDRESTEVEVGDISNVSGGEINIAGRDIRISKGIQNTGEIAEAFAKIAESIQKMQDGPKKSMAMTALDGLKEEASKGENANGGKVKEWISFLAQTAPDAFEVAIDTFIHPIKGLSTVFKKVAERARSER
jgi:hypothetical protein